MKAVGLRTGTCSNCIMLCFIFTGYGKSCSTGFSPIHRCISLCVIGGAGGSRYVSVKPSSHVVERITYDLISAQAGFFDICCHRALLAVCMDLDACTLVVTLLSARLSPIAHPVSIGSHPMILCRSTYTPLSRLCDVLVGLKEGSYVHRLTAP